jgi:GT2 family glycosyltransferase
MIPDRSTNAERTVSVVTVAYGAEPWLERSVHAALASCDEVVEVVLVDNGCTDGAVDRLDGEPGVVVVRPGEDLWFAAGCNLGVARSSAEIVAFVGPDAIVDPHALHRLAEECRSSGGIATACVVLSSDPARVNSAGNEFHFLGLSWSGGFGELVSDHLVAKDATTASGAGMALRRADFDRLGGFCGEFLGYYEDADLSLRAWQQGMVVRYVPEARIEHRYEFGRYDEKIYLIDRNRWLTILSCYGRRQLTILAPALLAQEAALWLLSAAQGWSGAKWRSMRWLWAHRQWIIERRASVQAARVVSDRDLAHLYAAELDPANLALPRWVTPLSAVLAVGWRSVRRFV